MLFVSCHLPLPPISGGRRRELELIKRISATFDIHLIVVSKTVEEDLRHVAKLRRYCRAIEVFEAQDARLAVLHGGDAVQVARHRCPNATRRIGEILAHERVDAIHIEGFYLMQHVPQWATTPLLLVEQNVEFELQRQQSLTSECAADLEVFASFVRTRAAEREAWQRAHVLAAVTAEDRDTILSALPSSDVRVVPDGADHIPNLRLLDGSRHPDRPDAPLVTFLANFAYAPNVDAARHLCQRILPRIQRRVPNVHVWLVGNAPPPGVRALESGTVRVTGRVPDVMPYLDTADVVVCPLRIGGGIKVKAIEALRRGKAFVATPVGVQGLPLEARRAVRIASDPNDFADATADLLGNPAQRFELERRAHRAAARLPTWDAAAATLEDTYDDLLRSARSRAPVSAVEPA